VDQILHAVLQNVAGGFVDLRRVIDTALLAERLTSGERVALAARARRYHLATGLWLQHRLVEEIAGLAMPREVALLAPSGAVRRLLDTVPVAERCLLHEEQPPPGYSHFLHWLCTPTVRLRWREIRRYLWPNTAGLMEMGHAPDALPGWTGRARLTLGRLKGLVELAAFLAGWASGAPWARPRS
jgi:hypothetical protein